MSKLPCTPTPARPNHNPRARGSSGSLQLVLVVHLPVIADAPPVDCLMADLVHRLFSTCAVAVGTTSNRVSSTKTSKTSGLSSTPASSVSLASSRLTSSGERLDMTSFSPLRVAPSDRGEPVRFLPGFQKKTGDRSVENEPTKAPAPLSTPSGPQAKGGALFAPLHPQHFAHVASTHNKHKSQNG